MYDLLGLKAMISILVNWGGRLRNWKLKNYCYLR